MVYVLLGLERGVKSARFFVARNRDLAARFRRSPTSNPIGLIDAKSVEKYENNWESLDRPVRVIKLKGEAI